MMKISAPMKVSLACSALILVAGGWVGWIKHYPDDQPGPEARSARPIHPESPGEGVPATGKSAPAAVPESPPLDFARVVSVAVEMENRATQGRMTTQEENARVNEMIAEIKALGPSQVDDYIKQVLACAEISENGRRWWLTQGFQAMAKHDTDRALELLVTHKSLFVGSPLGNYGLALIIGEIIPKNTKLAFEKLGKFVAAHPEFNRGEVSLSIVRKLVQTDIKKMYELLPEAVEPLGFETVLSVVRDAAVRSDTEEKSLSALAYLRDYLPRIEDEENRKKVQTEVLQWLIFKVGLKGYGDAQQWMKNAALSREESLISGLHAANNCRPQDTGQWLEWIEREIPLESVAENERQGWYERVSSMVRSWADSDTVSLAAWIETQKPGDLKDQSVCCYIYEICEDNPEEAAKWVPLMTLEKDRKYMLGKILQKGGFESHEEYKAFAERHGIE